MTGEWGAKQTDYLLLVFLQAKMLRLGRCPKSPCDNPCGRGRISVIKTLLFTQCTDCFWSVFETERLRGYERNEKAHLIILLPSAKQACFQILLISNEVLWCTYCGPGGQENKVKQWRSALVQELFSKHFKNTKKNTEHGCWTAEKYVTCLEITIRKLTSKNICKQEFVLFGKRCWNTQNKKTTKTNNLKPWKEGVELRKQRGKY